MKVAVASDHAGFKMKEELSEYLRSIEHQIFDFGTFSEESVDYPNFAFPAAEAVASGVAHFAVLICGTGVGMSITANKIPGIRAANCYSVDIAKLAREHNNANALCLGARFTDLQTAKDMIDVFFNGEFEGGRHMIRVEKIHSLTGL